MSKFLSFFYILFSLIFSSCQNQPKPIENSEKETTIKDSVITVVPKNADTSVAYMTLKKYLPEKIPGFKTEGYPDLNDNFTGEPTGETNSAFTSLGPASFIKHLYKKNDAEIAVEIIDFKASPSAYKEMIRMFNPAVKVDTELETKYPLEKSIPGTITQVIHSKTETKSTAHIFVCDRFLVNVNTVNTGKNNMIQETLQRINLKALMNDLCETKQ